MKIFAQASVLMIIVSLIGGCCFGGWPIKIHDANNNVLTVDFDPNTTIAQIKEYVSSVTHVPIDKIELSLETNEKNHPLDTNLDGKNLRDTFKDYASEDRAFWAHSTDNEQPVKFSSELIHEESE